jgi:hypothetical protein
MCLLQSSMDIVYKSSDNSDEEFAHMIHYFDPITQDKRSAKAITTKQEYHVSMVNVTVTSMTTYTHHYVALLNSPN